MQKCFIVASWPLIAITLNRDCGQIVIRYKHVSPNADNPAVVSGK
jgi:hypothetical protein